MYATVDRAELVHALRDVGPAIAKRAALPVLAGVHIQASANGLTLAGTDLEISLTRTLPADVAEPGTVLLPHKELAGMLRQGAPGDVTIEQNGAPSVRVGPAALNPLPVEDFPVLGGPTGILLLVSAPELADRIRRVGLAASRDEMRPVLTGVLAELDYRNEGDRSLVLTATDSYRLATAELATGAGAGLDSQRLGTVPARALAVLAKLAGAKGAPDSCALTFGPSQVSADLGRIRLVSRLIEGEFPNWRQLLPSVEALPIHADIPADELAAALGQLAPFARGGSPLALFLDTAEPPCSGIVAGKQDLGEAVARIPGARATGKAIAVGFNHGYLSDALDALAGSPTVRVSGRDALKPWVFTAADTAARYLLMPVRLKGGDTEALRGRIVALAPNAAGHTPPAAA